MGYDPRGSTSRDSLTFVYDACRRLGLGFTPSIPACPDAPHPGHLNVSQSLSAKLVQTPLIRGNFCENAWRWNFRPSATQEVDEF